jgi:hypothetical protein
VKVLIGIAFASDKIQRQFCRSSLIQFNLKEREREREREGEGDMNLLLLLF